MPPLATNLRNELGRAITRARQVAEAGARKALQTLAVEYHEPHGSMSPDERKLRNRLRARGRQLGDERDQQRGNQTIERLTHEVAYEHWHRMLFARFLAENNLLIHPVHGVAVSLNEIEELALEAGDDPHAMAASFAQTSLPQIFRSDDPVLEVTLAPETRQILEKLLDTLPTTVFTADDSLGWTYQYWQTEKKDSVNKSGNKIGADELPAVTQLFTEHYMVLFLYHNTIGAWHAGKVLSSNPSLAENAQSEEELRQTVRLRSQGGYDFEYLRFVKETREGDEEDTPTGPWRPAAGTFEGWPETTKGLKVLDPCCGSGHFLTEGFELLVRLRMDEEGVDLEDSIRGVLSENLHGLEIEPRCTQIAAFNVALSAWKLAGKPIELPALKIACSGLAPNSSKSAWLSLAEKAAAAGGMPTKQDFFDPEENLLSSRFKEGLSALYDLFEKAPVLGSLIDPSEIAGNILVADFRETQPLLDLILTRDRDDVEDTERAVAAQGMARAAELLAGEYTLVITNVPYLGRGKQSDSLKNHLENHFNEGKADLATAFATRCLDFCPQKGSVALVSPWGWTFAAAYYFLRKRLLKAWAINILPKIGEGGFGSTAAAGAFVVTPVITRTRPLPDHLFAAIDVSCGQTLAEKARLLESSKLVRLNQKNQLDNPDSRILFEDTTGVDLLSHFAKSYQGIKTGDDGFWKRYWWEFPQKDENWKWFQSTVDKTTEYGGCAFVLRWENEGANIARLQGHGAWGKAGITVSLMRELRSSIYSGKVFDSNVAALVLDDPRLISPLMAFCSNNVFNTEVRKIDPEIKVETGSLTKVPFNLKYWQKVADEKYPNGLPEPQSNDPTQWLFHGHPSRGEPDTVLQVAVGRLLGYQWPPEFEPEMHLAAEAREWVARCNELKELADKDGIVCLSATRGEPSAADRLRELLSAAFGTDWSAAKERELLAAAAGEGKKPPLSLEIWLRDKFYEEHCKLFHHRPFVWHIWDGNQNGFHCMVNAHKITGSDGEGRRTLEAITHSYLGDWIDRQKADQREGKEGADSRFAAAQDLQEQLIRILEGEPPYDIFVRWKPLFEQPLGWEPDINDGVRLNARPFMYAKLRKGGKKGAGVLRWKPNIKWKKDRGKEPESLRPREDFPWFWGCNGDGGELDRTDFKGGAEFDGNRWNDLHYNRAVKEAARAVRKGPEEK